MGEPLSILIVEDEPEFRNEFERMISTAPDMYVSGSVGNVADGLALLERGPFDVLLVDLGLPDGSGLTIIREAIRRWPDRCDVMVVSVFADMGHVLSAIEAGATGYLLKDSSPNSFLAQIRELHAGGSPVSPIIARQLLGRLSGSFAAPEAIRAMERRTRRQRARRPQLRRARLQLRRSRRTDGRHPAHGDVLRQALLSQTPGPLEDGSTL